MWLKEKVELGRSRKRKGKEADWLGEKGNRKSIGLKQ